MSKWLSLVGCLVALFLLSAPCARAEEIEPVFGIVVNPQTGTFSMDVLSSGCTKKQDFNFDLKGDVLTIMRTERDACKMLPHRVTLTYIGEEVGVLRGRSFRLNNPISFTTSLEGP